VSCFFLTRSLVLHRASDCTGVDKGPPSHPPMAGQKIFFVKIEGLLEPVVLNLSFRVRSNAMCLHLKDDISVTDILKIAKIT